MRCEKSTPATSSTVAIAETSTIARLTTGRPSARTPGISPGRSRPSDGALGRRRSRSRRGTAPLSSFGARLRSRWPQYGHSVMYGLTSARQFLQTTKRSGVPAIAFDSMAARTRRSHFWVRVAAFAERLRVKVALVERLGLDIEVRRFGLQAVQELVDVLRFARERDPQVFLGDVLRVRVPGPHGPVLEVHEQSAAELVVGDRQQFGRDAVGERVELAQDFFDGEEGAHGDLVVRRGVRQVVGLGRGAVVCLQEVPVADGQWMVGAGLELGELLPVGRGPGVLEADAHV